LYGSDILEQIELAMRPCYRLNRTTFSGYALCQWTHDPIITTRDYMSTTDTLRTLIKSNKEILDEYRQTLDRYVNKCKYMDFLCVFFSDLYCALRVY
jgi:hypothetical protein